MKRSIVFLGISTLVLGWATVLTTADITGTAHDFSGEVWAEGQICLPCHAPHNVPNGDFGPLWNHAVTTASYQLYGGDGTFVARDDALDERSILCMSCHDGTVAVDAFGGSGGTFFIFGSENLGTDLRDDHPVGATGEYPAGTGYNDPSTWEGTAGPGFILYEMDIGGTPTDVVSCATCHEAHNVNNNDFFLWVDNAGSALCLTCHNK
jgi:predicted CXXCH cytochrome family protein